MMKLIIGVCMGLFLLCVPSVDGLSPLVGDNYKVVRVKERKKTTSYEIKCTDCGKYITVYENHRTGKYAQGDSPWYTQYRSLKAAASRGCDARCD